LQAYRLQARQGDHSVDTGLRIQGFAGLLNSSGCRVVGQRVEAPRLLDIPELLSGLQLPDIPQVKVEFSAGKTKSK
jgi:hypothetical protein